MTAPLVVLTIGGSFALYSYLSTGNEQTYNNQGIIINLPTGPETRPKPSPTPLFRNTDPSYVTLFFTFWFLGTVTVGVYVQRGYKHDQSRGVNVSTSTTGRELMILCPGQLQLTPRYPRICRLILKSLLQYRPFRLEFLLLQTSDGAKPPITAFARVLSAMHSTIDAVRLACLARTIATRILSSMSVLILMT
jgi:hypothetical protein